MNTRLQRFLMAENLTQSQFADSLNVARANVSHILSGRNKPGYDFVEKLMKNYPDLNIEWLISGKGRMYKSKSEPVLMESGQHDSVLFEFESQDTPKYNAPATLSAPVSAPLSAPASVPEYKDTSKNGAKQPSISRIIVFYDDNSFQEFRPSGDNSSK